MARTPPRNPLDRWTYTPKPHEHGVETVFPSSRLWATRSRPELAAAEFERMAAAFRGHSAGDVPVAVRLVEFGKVVREERFQVTGRVEAAGCARPVRTRSARYRSSSVATVARMVHSSTAAAE